MSNLFGAHLDVWLDFVTSMYSDSQSTAEDEEDSLSREIDALLQNVDFEDEVITQCSSTKDSTTAVQPGGAQPGQSSQSSERSTAVPQKCFAVASQQKRPSADTKEQPEFKQRRTLCGTSVSCRGRSRDRLAIGTLCGTSVTRLDNELQPSHSCRGVVRPSRDHA